MTDRMARRRGRRAATLLLAGLIVSAAPGCATKKDLKLLRDEVLTLQARQDSLFRDQERNYRLILDTLRTSFDLQRDAQGQTSHRFLQLEQQLGRTESMITQLQVVVSELMNQLERMAAAQPAAGLTPPVYTSPPPDSLGLQGDDVALYNMGMQKMRENAPGTARVAFQDVIALFPDRPIAADAQFMVAETFVVEGNPERAIAEFVKVPDRWPNAPKAPQALLRAGIVAQDQGNAERARTYFDDLLARYPTSDAALEARRRIGG